MFPSVAVRISPRKQGDIGERSALCWLIDHGATVYLPFGHSPDIDLIADFGDRLSRVQVKTTSVFHNRPGRLPRDSRRQSELEWARQVLRRRPL